MNTASVIGKPRGGFFSEIIGISVPVLLFILFLSSPDEVVRIGSMTLDFCIRSVIPSLLPFMVLSSLFVSLGVTDVFDKIPEKPFRFLFGVSPKCAPAVLLGILSGFPVGARTASLLYAKGSCTKSECEKLVSFCNNASPAFVLSAVGVSLWNDLSVGVILFVSQTAASLMCGMLLFRKKDTDERLSAAVPPDTVRTAHKGSLFSSVVAAVSSSALSLVSVCGFILFFSVCAGFFAKSGIFSFVSDIPGLSVIGKETVEAVFSGMIEFSSGLRLAAAVGGLKGITASAFILGFSGCSVHCQVASCVCENGISLRGYFVSKILCAFLTACFSAVLFVIFK